MPGITKLIVLYLLWGNILYHCFFATLKIIDVLKRLLVLSTVVVTICAFITIDPELQAIMDKLQRFQKNYPQEKVHLHLDKPFYSIGDTVYFKAYVVNAVDNTPSALSRILYVDLNDNDSLRKKVVLDITGGIASGTMVLGDSLQDGNYHVSAYTNWMRNFDADFYFKQDIEVGDALNEDFMMQAVTQYDKAANQHKLLVTYAALSDIDLGGKEVSYKVLLNNKEVVKGSSTINKDKQVTIALPSLTAEQRYDLVTTIAEDKNNKSTKTLQFAIPAVRHVVQFFPEGGQLVNGIPAVVGFKAIGQDGLSIDLTGEVADETGEKVATLKTEFAGIGRFTFTPSAGHVYKAAVKYANGVTEQVSLPAAGNAGYSLSIDHTQADKLQVRIAESGTGAKTVMLIGQSNNREVASEKLTLANGVATTTVPTQKLPPGIVQFTLFDAGQQPVAERLVFMHTDEHLQVTVTPGKSSYAKKEKVTMQVEVKDEFDEPVEGNFSIAVTDGSVVSVDNNAQTITSNLLLTADIKGHIESPGYYFSGGDPAKIKALDNLLLTQGWRRFAWKDVLGSTAMQTAFNLEKTLSVSGQVLTAKGVPAAKANVTLMSKKGSGFLLDTITDNNGNFVFDRLNFTDDMLFALKAATAEGSNDVIVKINNDASASPVQISYPFIGHVSDKLIVPFMVNSNRRFSELRRKGMMNPNEITLKEVTLKSKELTKVEEALLPSANLNGPGNADQVLTYLDIPNCNDLSMCLPGKVRGVFFKSVLINNTMCILPFANTGMGTPMMIVMDGMPMSTIDGTFSLSNINANDIQSIEVLRTGGFLTTYGLKGAAGVLVITTKRGGLDYNGLDAARLNRKAMKGMMFFKVSGYALNREFYNPAPGMAAAATENARSTVYWNPSVVTDDEGKATIEFYNYTSTGKYNVAVEGISVEGKTGSARLTFK